MVNSNIFPQTAGGWTLGSPWDAGSTHHSALLQLLGIRSWRAGVSHGFRGEILTWNITQLLGIQYGEIWENLQRHLPLLNSLHKKNITWNFEILHRKLNPSYHLNQISCVVEAPWSTHDPWEIPHVQPSAWSGLRQSNRPPPPLEDLTTIFPYLCTPAGQVHQTTKNCNLVEIDVIWEKVIVNAALSGNKEIL